MNNLGGLALLLGVALNTIAWTKYRKPEVPYWTFSAPWHMTRHLLPTGVMLYKIGCTVIAATALFAIAIGAFEA